MISTELNDAITKIIEICKNNHYDCEKCSLRNILNCKYVEDKSAVEIGKYVSAAPYLWNNQLGVEYSNNFKFKIFFNCGDSISVTGNHFIEDKDKIQLFEKETVIGEFFKSNISGYLKETLNDNE